MMTRNEATERARKLWGTNVKVSPTWPSGSWWIDVDNKCHKLDGNGHTDCHKECSEYEKQL